MLILALDTSGLSGSVAVARGEECLAERVLDLGVHHGQSLVAEIDRLLKDHALRPREVELVAVSIGPGSFTGLRVGVVFAKTFAWATGCRVAAVGTHEAIAAVSPHEPLPPHVVELHVVTDAQRGDVFVQVFDRSAGGWTVRGPVRITNTSTWASALGEAAVCGPAAGKVRYTLPAGAVVLPEPGWHPHAAAVARLGFQAAVAGQLNDPWSIEPLYLRRSSAEDKWDALHNRQCDEKPRRYGHA